MNINLGGLGTDMFIKKIFIAAGIIGGLTISAVASDIIVDNNTSNGTFSYIGKGSASDHMGGEFYDIYSMEVSRSEDGIMTVRINTKFVDINDQGETFGDLFMSTTGWNPTGDAATGSENGYEDDHAFNTGTQWDYVYDLNGERYLTDGDTDSGSARLQALKAYDMNDDDDKDNFVYGTDRKVSDPEARHLYRSHNAAYDQSFASRSGSVEANTANNYLEFIFDVSGTGLATAQQIAFHWTMSCANDIIEGEVTFAGKVPEPAAVGLLLLGLTGVGFARRRKEKT